MKFSHEVYNIIVTNRQPPMTAGEIFAEYKRRHPNTTRSRNEVAKRVNDLVNTNMIRPCGKRVCSFSGAIAQTWTAMSDSDHVVPVIRSAARKTSNRPASELAYDDRVFLKNLYIAAQRLKNSFWFRLFPAKFKDLVDRAVCVLGNFQ